MSVVGYIDDVRCINSQLPSRLKGAHRFQSTECYFFEGVAGEQKAYEVTHYRKEKRSWVQILKCVVAVALCILLVGIPLIFSPVRECISRGFKDRQLTYFVKNLHGEDIKERIENGNYQLILYEEDLDVIDFDFLQKSPSFFINIFMTIARQHGSNAYPLLAALCLKSPNYIRDAVKCCVFPEMEPDNAGEPKIEVIKFLVELVRSEARSKGGNGSQSEEMGIKDLRERLAQLEKEAIEGWFPNLTDAHVEAAASLNLFNCRQIVQGLVYELGVSVIPFIDITLLQDKQFIEGLKPRFFDADFQQAVERVVDEVLSSIP